MNEQIKKVREGEPILFLNSNEVNGTGWRGSNTQQRIDEKTGRVVEERLPATPFLGSFDDPVPHPDGGRRFITMLRHEGHVVSVVLTNAAADLDIDSPYARWQRAEAHRLGWIPWFGQCLARSIKRGLVNRDSIVDKSLLAAAMCRSESLRPDQPCPHTIAEREARMKAHKCPSSSIQEAQDSAQLEKDSKVAAAIAKAVASALAPESGRKGKP